MLAYLKGILTQPATYSGLGTILLAAGMAAPMADAVTTALAAAAGLVAVVLTETGSKAS